MSEARSINTSLCSIEISHIYLDQPFSTDQTQSVREFQDLVPKLNSPFQTVVLLDNYNIQNLDTKPQDVFDELKKLSIEPNHFALEKDLIVYANNFLDTVEIPKVKKQYEVYIRKYNKYPCSLLTAIWYLLRLGYLEDSQNVMTPLKKNEKFIPATRLINILPESFETVEGKCKKLIQASNFKQAVNQIENVFYTTKEEAKSKKRELL